MTSATHSRSLGIELALVFVLLPGVLAIWRPGSWIYTILWVALILCIRTLRKYHTYDFLSDWNRKALCWANIKPLLLRFLPFAFFLLGFVLYLIPEHFLSLPRRGIGLWIMVMVLYPAISVIPQEFIFRSFFMIRYRACFASPAALVLANGLIFGWVHIVLANWVAIVFSAIGGFLFAHTYQKYRSLALCCVEHAMYGWFIFTIGMGYFFYHGAVR